VDCNSILYQDLSDWMSEYELPEQYTVVITPPSGDPVALSMFTVGVNMITADDLLAPTEDGIYCFQATNCGVTYTRYKAVTCKLDCALDMFTSRIANSGKDGDVKHAHLIESYIKAIHYNTERGFKEEAEFYYDLAKRELDCYKCKC
jgi:hypothetical protein